MAKTDKKRKHEETTNEEEVPETTEENPNKKQKVVPPITSEEFKKDAKPIQITIAGKTLEAKPVVNKTGSFGWQTTGSHSVVVGERVLQIQFNFHVTVPGSNTKKSSTKKNKSKKK
jgi:hypothetical protein